MRMSRDVFEGRMFKSMLIAYALAVISSFLGNLFLVADNVITDKQANQAFGKLSLTLVLLAFFVSSVWNIVEWFYKRGVEDGRAKPSKRSLHNGR